MFFNSHLSYLSCLIYILQKTSQALREGQPKLKQKLAGAPTNLTAAATRTSIPGSSSSGPPPHEQHHEAYQPPPAPQEFAASQQSQPLDMNEYSRAGLNGISEQHEYRWDPNDQTQNHHHQQHQQSRSARPTLQQGGQSDMSLMSDISASFRHMMNDEETRNTFDEAFQSAIRDIEVPDNPYYYGEEENFAEMQPPPPRQMVEERMDSFRRQLMGIASPQVSQMSLSSAVGGSSLNFNTGSSHRNSTRSNDHHQAHHNNNNNTGDIVVPPRDSAPVGEEYHFQANRREDAVDELLSVGGLSKLSLMSGMSESTLDPHAIAGSGSHRLVHNGGSELTLDSHLAAGHPRGSSRRMAGNRGVSTRSAAMSEVSALDFLQEQENEDDDLDAQAANAVYQM